MVGIVSYGGYIPYLRIERKTIAAAWERAAIAGERSVANNDEDSITMAVEAASNSLYGRAREDVDGLFFASTTCPYQEKMNASIIAAAADLKREIMTVDYTNSLRCGISALKTAVDSVNSGSTANLLVTAADTRAAYPKSDQEQTFGDGAAAVMIGNRDPIATLEGGFSVASEMMDVWRNPEDKFVKQWEGRFILGEGYTAHTREAVSGILNKYSLKPENIAKAIIPAPDGRSHQGLMRALGFDAETQVQDPLLGGVGYCGAAQPLMMLVSALEEAKPGDLLLLAAYADGADAVLFKATDRIASHRPRRNMKTLLNNKMMFSSYAKFLSFKNVVEAQPGDPFRLLPSATATWRERNSSMRCHASQCRKCGYAAFPIQRICNNCRSKDEYEEIRLTDHQGSIFTFSRDNLAGRSDDPVVIQTVAEMAKGVRFYGLMTDCDPSTVEIGQAVELTFRRFYEGAGFHNYFWKLKPADNGDQHRKGN
jgi:3-hydroxy-3-methylglutaryl CoA synthase